MALVCFDGIILPPFLTYLSLLSACLPAVLPACLPGRSVTSSVLLRQRLERLLGVSGPNAKKKRAKLEREIEVEDGMGDEFGAFLSDLDRITDVRERVRGRFTYIQALVLVWAMM